MNVIENAEKECSILGALFQSIVNEMKNSSTLWEDLVTKASKLHVQLKATLIAFSSFLDAFQRIADLATNTKGQTRDIGTALTRLCLRHKAIEQKLKSFTSSLVESFVQPLNERIEDWKKSANTLDKDHAKGLKDYKKLRNELRKKATETVKLQKKCKKLPKNDILHNKLNSAIQEVSNYYSMLEEREKQALRSAMIEERSRFCTIYNLIKPIMELEISMSTEMSHVDDIVQCLNKQTAEPNCLPSASEQVIKDIKGIDYSTIVAFKTPPSSPGSLSSRKSSVCSINSISSSSSSSTNSRSPQHNKQIPIVNHNGQYIHPQYNQNKPIPGAVAVSRLSSVSSQDSGFTSQEQFFARPPSPLEESERELDGSASPLLVVCSTLNAWAKRPEPSTGKHPHTVTGAPEPAKCSRPAITAHTFDPPDPSLFEKPNWNISEETGQQMRSPLISEDGLYGGLSRQHSVPSRRYRMRDLSLDRRSPRRDHPNARLKPTKPPSLPEYYGTRPNMSLDENNDQQRRIRSATLSSEATAIDTKSIVWRDRNRHQTHNSSTTTLLQETQYTTSAYYGQLQPSFESVDETLDEMYEYLSRSVPSNDCNQQNSSSNKNSNDGLRRGMSVIEKPAPPIRRTPSMNTSTTTYKLSSSASLMAKSCVKDDAYIELQARLRARLKRAEELADVVEYQSTTNGNSITVVNVNNNNNNNNTNDINSKNPRSMQQQHSTSRSNHNDTNVDDFPPPPPDFFFSDCQKSTNCNRSVHINNSSNIVSIPIQNNTNEMTKNSSFLQEIQRGIKLRKTVTNDKSLPRMK